MDEMNNIPETGAATPEMQPQKPAKELPVRRVGSFTLGVCLIAAGVSFLCYHFVPGFAWETVLKIAPAAGLILMGGEVLFFVARPGRWKYDFGSVFICLVLMGMCFVLSLLPALWDDFNPERHQTSTKLGQEYTNEVYGKIKETAPNISVKDIDGNVYLYTSTVTTLEEVHSGNGYVRLSVDLFGNYDNAAGFAQDCRRVADAVKECTVQPNSLIITWVPDNDPGQSLDSGSLQHVEQYTLELDGIAQLDWTADQMAKQTEVQYLTDEENEEPDEPDESEVSSEENSELSGSKRS